MQSLAPSQKGAIAEIESAAAAVRLELFVLRPMSDGGRYDLGFDIGHRVLRIQCKWASRCGDILTVRCATSRHTPRGYVKTTYTADQVDAIAAYSPDVDRCYLIPIEQVAGMAMISLRLAPTRNNQAYGVRWAKDYELATSLRAHWGCTPADRPAKDLTSCSSELEASKMA